MSIVSEVIQRDNINQRSICSMFRLPIDRLTVKQVIEKVESYIKSRQPHQIAYLNAHCINRTFEDKEYREIIQQCDLVYADGMGVVWASHLTHSPLPERVNIGDFLFDLCRLCEKKNYKVYFLGSDPGVAERAVQAALQQAPKLQVVGYSHGYFTPDEEKGIIADIIKSKPDILLVGFGVPEQEKWIAKNIHKLGVPVVWGVGALFEYYAGKVSRAPYWMRSHGLEWLYRLVLEPSRLWKRYLIGNVLFIMRVIALVIVDILSVSASWFSAYWIRMHFASSFGGEINPITTYLYAFPLIVGLWIFCSAWYGLYNRSKPFSEFQEFLAIAKAAVLALLITMAVGFIFKRPWDLGRSVVFISGGLNFLFLLVSRKLNSFLGSKKS